MSTESRSKGFFRCPHCKEKTITAWAKLKTRGACPACGERFVASCWGLIPSSLAVPLGIFATMLLFFRPAGLPPFWVVLGVGVVAAFALAAGVYLFTTFLYRKGSRAARWDAISFFVFLAAIVVYAATNTERGPDGKDGFFGVRLPGRAPEFASSMHYGDAAMHRSFKEALEKAGIPYRLELYDGKEFVSWPRAQDAAVREIQGQIERAPRLTGGSVSFDDPAVQKEFASWLAKKGVKYETTRRFGRERITWERGADDLVNQFMQQRPSKCDKTAAAPADKKCG